MEIIALRDYKIHGCTGCSSCQKDTGDFTCIQKDDGKRKQASGTCRVLSGTGEK